MTATLLKRLLASDRLWIAASTAFSRVSNFITNVMLARYGGAAVVGTYSATLNTAAAAAQPVLWSVSTSATLESRAARSEPMRRAVVTAHVYWALLLGVLPGLAFPFIVSGAGVDGAHEVLATVAGLVVLASLLVTTALQGALHGVGAYKPVAVRLAVVSVACVVVAVPSVLFLGLVGGLVTLILQYLLLAAALLHLARPTVTERAMVKVAFAATRQQLLRSVPNVVATLVATGASWLTTILLVQQSHGMAGVGVFSVGASWLTILMMPVAAWGGLSMRTLSSARAESPRDFATAVRKILVKDVSFTLAMAAIVFVCADRIAALYAMTATPLPAILRWTAVTALVLAALQVFERSMFCRGEQRVWLGTRMVGNLCTLGLAYLLVPVHLEYGAVAILVGHTVTALLCAVLRDH